MLYLLFALCPEPYLKLVLGYAVSPQSTGIPDPQKNFRTSELLAFVIRFAVDEWLLSSVGKGMLGWVETRIPQENAALAAKTGKSDLWNSFGLGQVSGTAKGNPPSTLHDIKVVVGNKVMMAEEGISISKSTDEYMRDMEVSLITLIGCHTKVLLVQRRHP